MMYNISFYFILFLIYSIIGWILEVITVFIETKKIINRGFMLGPYCPIYGYSSIIMIFYLNHYKDNPLTVFLLAVIICSFVEYLISYIMEKLFWLIQFWSQFMEQMVFVAHILNHHFQQMPIFLWMLYFVHIIIWIISSRTRYANWRLLIRM